MSKKSLVGYVIPDWEKHFCFVDNSTEVRFPIVSSRREDIFSRTVGGHPTTEEKKVLITIEEI